MAEKCCKTCALLVPRHQPVLDLDGMFIGWKWIGYYCYELTGLRMPVDDPHTCGANCEMYHREGQENERGGEPFVVSTNPRRDDASNLNCFNLKK